MAGDGEKFEPTPEEAEALLGRPLAPGEHIITGASGQPYVVVHQEGTTIFNHTDLSPTEATNSSQE